MSRKNKTLIRVGIIGCGNIAGLNEQDDYREKPCTHAGAYRLRKDVDIVGCCDALVDKAKNFAEYFSVGFYTDQVNHLLDQGVDVLSICVPYRLNLSVIKKVVTHQKKPKKILLEKPIASSLSESKKIVSLCQKAKVQLYVNNRRLLPFYQMFKGLSKKEFGGNLISISAWCSSGMHAIGIHMVDLLRNVAGEVDSLIAYQEKERIMRLPYSANFHPDDPRYTSLINFKNGVKGTLFNSACTDYTFFEVEAIFKTGRLRASDNGNKLVIQKKQKPGTSTLSYKLQEEKSVDIKTQPLFKLLINEVLDGNYQTSLINGKEALASYRVIEAMKESSRRGKPVNIKDLK